MAMNKAEQAALEQLKQELAFRWPTENCPEKTVLAEMGKETIGWLYNAYSKSVEKYWSNSVTHGTFYNGQKSGGSQRGVNMYATKREALVAMRWDVCRRFAKELREIDIKMESEA